MAIIRQSPASNYGVSPMWFSTISGQYYQSKEAAEAGEQRFMDSPEYKAQQKKESDLSNLKSQILDQWKQLGVPSIGGGLPIEQRAASLADRLYANQITDISKLRLGTGTRKTQVPSGEEYGQAFVEGEEPVSFLQYDGRQIGFLGNADDGGRNADPTGYLQPGGLASWTAAGKGAVGYTAQAAPNGQVYFVPSWGSTSDVSTVAPILGLGLMLVPGLQGVGASIGAALAPAAGAAAQAAIGNAIVQGAMAEATGGDFLKGAALSGVGSLAGGLQPGLSEALGGGNIGQIGSNALIGGTMAELSGGDFAKGAVLSGVQSGIQQARLAAAEDYLQSFPAGYTQNTAPTEADVLDVIAAESPNFRISDATFRPDYSLSTGAPVIPEMGAQGIQVPTINQVIDVLDGVDYSLSAPSSGLGLVMPTAPNLDSMGGGQGITVPVAGGTLTEAGVIPESYTPVLGDPNSFINQPAPDSGVTIAEPTEAAPKDISKELAALDIAKALAPAAVGALLAENLTSQKPESTSQQNGFPIVPIPSDWRSPEYNMAFTPSAPIDFGSPELLRGTQWERPMSLSTVINALNQPMIAPEVQQMMTQFQAPTMPYETGINDIIGEIGGRPVSIGEIISGIQSGQNYGS